MHSGARLRGYAVLALNKFPLDESTVVFTGLRASCPGDSVIMQSEDQDIWILNLALWPQLYLLHGLIYKCGAMKHA
jgi:hypothetical protein